MTEKAPSIVIVAGEASGDMQGAYLATKLRELMPAARIRGIGSRRMREAGVELLYDSSTWGAIGIAEAVKLAPRLLLVLRQMRLQLKADPPDVLALVDFGAFNVRLGRSLHSAQTKVLYYFPPGSWNRGSTYERLKGMADRVVTPFPWSAEALVQRGFRADFFGHPLLDTVSPGHSRKEFCERSAFDAGRPLIGLLPGSRRQELAHNLPVLLVAAGRLCEKAPDLQFAVPLPSFIDSDAIAGDLARVPWVDAESPGDVSREGASDLRLPIAVHIESWARREGLTAAPKTVRVKVLPGMTHDVLAHSRAAVVTAGTATVEAAILGCPMVITYRASRLTALQYKLLGRNIKFVGMPNIIADREICPELMAGNATPARVAEALIKLIEDSPERDRMLDDLAEVRSVLGGPGAVEKTARAVLELLVPGQDSRDHHD